MMSRVCRVWFAALLLLLLLPACRKTEFTVSIELPPNVSDNYPVLYYASDSQKGWLTEQVAVVSGGKGELKCRTVLPTLVYLFTGSNEPALVFYAERGDHITLSGDNAYSPATWSVSGNDISEALSEWRLANRDALAARDGKKIRKSVADYVRKNPAEPAAALLLQLYYDRGEDAEGFDRLFSSLKDEAADPRWTELVGRNDMTEGFGPMPAKVASVVLRTRGSGCDTLNLKRGSTLFYFSDNNSDNRDADIVRLRRAVRERRDSLTPAVVSVCMESDSMAWHYRVPVDSLRGAMHAWMPLSFSDPAAVSLGVKRIPQFVVVRSGNIIYRGDDVELAVKTAANGK